MHEVRARAFAWVAKNHKRFVPGARGSVEFELFVRKAFVEMALLVGLAARAPDRVPPDAYATLTRCVRSVSARRSYKELAARDRSAILLYAATYTALRLLGEEDEEFRWLIEQVAGGRHATAIERLPFRHLDLLHTLDTAGIRHRLPRPADVLPLSILAGDPTTVDVRETDAYALTHTLFYATDFGAKRMPWPSEQAAERTRELIDALLMIYRVRGNPDLVGELICCHACLHIHQTPELARAWAYLGAVQDADGRVPGPPGAVVPEPLDDAESTRQWLTSYHTTIVAALAGVLTDGGNVQPADDADAAKSGPVVDLSFAHALYISLQRAVDWVAQESQQWNPNEAMPTLAAAVFATHQSASSPLLDASLHNFAARIEAMDQAEARWAEYGSDVVFTLALGLQERRIECRPIRRVVNSVAKTTLQAADTLLETRTGVAHIRRALAQLVELEVLPLEEARTFSRQTGSSPLDHFTGDSPVEIAKQVLANADESSKHCPDPEAQRVGELLAVGLLDACGEYRLGEAALLLRALAAIGWTGHRVVIDSVDFLLRQQTMDGAFGYTASDDDATRLIDQRRWTQSLLVALADFDRARQKTGDALTRVSGT